METDTSDVMVFNTVWTAASLIMIQSTSLWVYWNKVTIQFLTILQNGEKSSQQMSLGLLLMKVKCNMCLMSFGFYLRKLDSENTKPYAWNYTFLNAFYKKNLMQ